MTAEYFLHYSGEGAGTRLAVFRTLKRAKVASVGWQTMLTGYATCTGTVDGLTLRARGVLLEHRAAAVAVEEARAIARLRVRVPAVRDWVIDYSAPGALWIVSDGAWYRCVPLHTCLVSMYTKSSVYVLCDDTWYRCALPAHLPHHFCLCVHTALCANPGPVWIAIHSLHICLISGLSVYIQASVLAPARSVSDGAWQRCAS